jgi:hypothetical protein
MTKESNSTDDIWTILDKSPCVTFCMSKGLINHRALAKHIIKEKKMNISLDAAISAIRRYEIPKTNDIFNLAYKILGQTTTMSTKSSISNISLIKDNEVQKKLPQLFSIIHYDQGDVLRIIQADGAIKLLIDDRNLDRVKEIFPEDKIIRIDKNIAEINVHMHPQARDIPGVLAAAANELAINGINILEAMSCFPEWLWFVDESDLLKAYNALNRLCLRKEEFLERRKNTGK